MKLLRRHVVWLIVATFAGLAGAYLYHSAQPVVYTSTAKVDVEPNAVAGTAPVTPDMATEELVATSGLLVSRIAAAVNVPASTLTGKITATASTTSTVLSISCTRPTAGAAQACAGDAASIYIFFRNLGGDTAAKQAKDPYNVTLVGPATLPSSPAGIGKKILLPVGAILGLSLGLGGIVLRDRFDHRVRDRADLERYLEAPVLAGIPRLRRGSVSPALVFSRAPQSKAAEAYRYLRSRIAPVWDGGRMLLVAGPQGVEGRTSVASNLAQALAQAGTSVILVDADLRHSRQRRGLGSHPSLTEIFRAGDRSGLSELLAGTASLDDVAQPSMVPGLRFVGAGASPGQALDMFENAKLTKVFGSMKAAADMVIVDSSPVLAVSDTVSLARVSDVVLMVADVRHTERGAVSAAVQVIQASGPPIVGVLNEESARVGHWAPASEERPHDWSALRAPSSPEQQPAWRPDSIGNGNGNGNGKRPAISPMPTLSYELTDTMPFRLTDTGTGTGTDPSNS
jgi:polysaccharide biosynthesis transport protein